MLGVDHARASANGRCGWSLLSVGKTDKIMLGVRGSKFGTFAFVGKSCSTLSWKQ